MKECIECESTKPLTEFYIKKSGRPMSRCKPCEKAIAKERARRKYKQDPRGEAEARRNRYQKQDKTRKNQTTTEWVKANPDKRKAILHKYYENNKDTFRARNHRRRARLVGNGGSFTKEEWVLLKEQHEHTCLCCGKKEPEIMLTPDHVIPVSKGGSGSIGNIQPLCDICNKRKSDKIIDYRR